MMQSIDKLVIIDASFDIVGALIGIVYSVFRRDVILFGACFFMGLHELLRAGFISIHPDVLVEFIDVMVILFVFGLLVKNWTTVKEVVRDELFREL